MHARQDEGLGLNPQGRSTYNTWTPCEVRWRSSWRRARPFRREGYGVTDYDNVKAEGHRLSHLMVSELVDSAQTEVMVPNARNVRCGRSAGRGASRGVAVLVQTQKNAQILQITRDHQLFQQQQRETVHEDTGLNSFLKGKPPQFGGDFNPEGAEKWLKEKEKEFQNLRQGMMTVGEYTRKFESLLKYSEFYRLHPREEWMCEKYQDGLKYDIQRVVLPLHIMRFGELIERCLELEGIDNRKNQYGSGVPTRNNNHKGHFNRGHGGRTQQGGRPYQRPTPYHNQDSRRLMFKCYSCGGAHLNKDCPNRNIGACFRCG
ncbi:hypothetical protein KIW84_020060 [Lathyrus oleraceus]|uniref:Retrotransposon gag domain-containing protein n=1 Tax=Pisum sativum TaxID=3888 RepID=A0A9D4Y447_PEA|nr:hypothetical protein KIW84_020060 [Pisum sativum]